ncbi:MAG TPA: matrixin family metalloprotease [Actinomycetota bacterium]|nr:matrixin family metalloprotease [Actinomycetota bacterium]
MHLRRIFISLTSAAIFAGAVVLPGQAAPTLVTLPKLTLAQVQDLARVDVPPAGVGLLVHADFPPTKPLEVAGDAFTSITLDVTSKGVVTRSATPKNSGSATDEKVDECTDPTFASVGKRWSAQDVPVEFAFNRKSVPSYLSPWLTTRSLREAHHAWAETNTKCSDDDAIEFSFNYVGEVSAHIKYDNLSVADFGELDHATAISYVWYTNSRIREVDLRFNKNYMWTNRPGIPRYNVKNVAVHEIGHHLGLDDLTNPHGSLTMYGVVSKGELRKTTLGRGDVKGAELLTP